MVCSHGMAPQPLAELKAKGFSIIDATCPFVKKAQTIAASLGQEGYQVVILGDRNHPEVKGILGWAGNDALVVENADEAQKLPSFPKIGFLAQTTQTKNNFFQVEEVLKSKTDELKSVNTICEATKRHQDSALELSKKVDLMLVIGGKNSSNTKKLAQICSSGGVPTYHLETADDLIKEIFKGVEKGKIKIGITAGASTPDWIIEEVIGKMAEFENREEQVLEAQEQTAAAEENAMDLVAEDQANDAENAAPEAQDAENINEEEAAAPADDEAVSKRQEEEASSEQAKDSVQQESSFAEQYQLNIKDVRRGARVKGTVVQVKDTEVLVDIGGKSEGILPSSELTAEEAADIPAKFHVGDEIDVIILRKENQEGYPVLSKKRIDQEIAWDKLQQAKDEGQTITGKVLDVVKGGLLVDVGLRGFIPASLVSLGYAENLATYVGNEIQVKVIECEKNNNKLVLSAKAVLKEASLKQKEETWATIAEGQIKKGIVRRLTNFGAFIDIGGVDGLLHVSEMAWHRVNQASDVLKQGDEVEVYVLGVDPANEKISLSLKKLIPNPWEVAKEKYLPGTVIKAKVMRTAPFGAFLEVEPGVEGLVHISQMAHQRVGKTEDVVKPGDVVEVQVLSVDSQAKRMSLSIKATLPKEEVKEELKSAEAGIVAPLVEEVSQENTLEQAAPEAPVEAPAEAVKEAAAETPENE